MEVAGVVLGAIPIIIEAAKAYRTAYELITTFRRWAHEVNRVQKHLRIQRTRFLNECCLLLSSALRSRQLANDIIEEKVDIRTGIDVEQRFRECLGTSYNACVDVVTEIKEYLKDFEDTLQRISGTHEGGWNSTNSTHFSSNVKNALYYTLKKGHFFKKLRELESLNENLTAIRSQILAMQRIEDQNVVTRSESGQAMVTQFYAIREASTALHEAFVEAWDQSCPDIAHRHHHTLLCLDAKSDQCVHLEVAISSENVGDKTTNISASTEAPTWLHVRTTKAKGYTSNIHGKRRLEQNSVPESLWPCIDEFAHVSSPPQSCGLPSLTKTTLNSSLLARKKQKLPGQGNCSVAQSDEVEPQAMPDDARSLCKVGNICQYFKQGICNSSNGQTCFGYLQASQDLKHFVYSTTYQATVSARRSQRSLTTLGQIVQAAGTVMMTALDQLEMACKIATAVLQFHSTPWLNSEWDLEDIGLFCSSNLLDEAAIRTLHLTAGFPKSCLPEGNNTDPLLAKRCSLASEKMDQPTVLSCFCPEQRECRCPSNAVNDQALLYGVDNMALCSLGIALLQLGHRESLKSISADRKDPNILVTARRLASYGASPLGPEFQKIARKCLRCDFNSGTDLRSAKLQHAVFSDVVCELKGMMDRLSI
ncbi:MAG: hypothetical protein Q9165_004923 [Trypethelium subeluteriae]